MNLSMIITAAGLSSRYPPNKLLLEIDGLPVIAKTVSVFGGFQNDIIIVTGHESQKVGLELTQIYPAKLTFTFNPDFAHGLSTSVRTGLGAINLSAEIVGFCNGDRPFIRRRTAELLANTARQNPTKIVYPIFANKPGQPVFFPSDLIPELRRLTGDTGGRVVRENHPGRCLPVEVDDPGVITDMDAYLDKLQ